MVRLQDLESLSHRFDSGVAYKIVPSIEYALLYQKGHLYFNPSGLINGIYNQLFKIYL